MEVQTRVREYLDKITFDAQDRTLVNQALIFLKDELSLTLPFDRESASHEKKRRFVCEQLDRPIRVCGMVKNEGEPGGGPFWVREDSGESSLQIVETAQIDPESREQQEILRASTHFNPVDLVCGVRDRRGASYDLRDFIDPSAVFISKK